MKNNYLKLTAIFMICVSINSNLFSQTKIPNTTQTPSTYSTSEFWQKVQFGGGLTLDFGSGFTNIGVSPTAVYNVNEFFSVGTGLQLSYVSAKNTSKSMIYGGSIIALANPIESIQLSAELEQLNVNRTFDNNTFPKQQLWNTGLWLGGGYRTNNITIGARYNVLHSDTDGVYNDAFMPFVRVMF